MVYTRSYQCSPPEQLKQNTNQKTALIQKKSFYCWVYSSKKIQLCSFQISWKIPFLLQHISGIYMMLSVQPPWTAKTKHKSKNCWFKRTMFTAEFIPVQRFNLAHSNFPGKVLLSYNTVIVYTGCYQYSPPEQLKQNTNQKTADSKEQCLLLSLFQYKDSTLLIPTFLENSFCLTTQSWQL